MLLLCKDDVHSRTYAAFLGFDRTTYAQYEKKKMPVVAPRVNTRQRRKLGPRYHLHFTANLEKSEKHKMWRRDIFRLRILNSAVRYRFGFLTALLYRFYRSNVRC